MLMLLEAWDGITPFPECCILKAKKIFIENRPHDPGTRFSFPFCKMELESDNCPNFQRLASSSKEYSKTYQFPRPPDTPTVGSYPASIIHLAIMDRSRV